MAPLIARPGKRGTSRAPAFVRLQALDGVWEIAGADRRRGVWPEEIDCDWDDWGPKTARFLLRREAGRSYPDITGLTPVEIEQGAGLWEGYIDQTPVQDEHTLAVECIGWPDQGGDDLLAKTYLHSDQAAWRDIRSFLDVDLGLWPGNLAADQDGGAMRFGCNIGEQWVAGRAVGFMLDLGPGNAAKHVVLDVQRIAGGAGTELYIRGADYPGALHPAVTGHYEDGVAAVGLGTISTTGQNIGADFVTARRYVSIFLYRSGATYTATLEDKVRVRRVLVMPAAGYESGSASNLKASTVLADLLPRLCSDWSTDTSGIDATTLNFPHVAATAPRSFREWVDAMNAPHGYIRKLERGRRFRFKARPSIPILAAGAWPGNSYRDASKNATRDLYNKAIGQGTNGAGEPIAVERYAAQLAGVAGEQVATPGFVNPSFDTNATGWAVNIGAVGSTITRQTAQVDTAPGAGAWDKAFEAYGSMVTADLGVGTWKKGTFYRITLKMRDDLALGGAWFYVKAGSYADDDMAVSPLIQLSQSWKTATVIWRPRRDYSVALGDAPQLQIITQPERPPLSTDMQIDTGTDEIVRPTLLDRRNRIRSKTVEMPTQSVDPAVMEAFADTWLQSHIRTKASGQIDVAGDTLRDYTTGEPRRPFELGERTGELVCLLNEIDPDTGGIGRDIPITAVSAAPGKETAQLTLDTPYDDFQALASRYDMIAGRT